MAGVDFIDGIVAKRGGGDAPAAKAKAPGYGAVKGDALSTLARILRLTKEDRGAFDAALTDLIEACMEDEEKESPADEAAEPDTEAESDTEE